MLPPGATTIGVCRSAGRSVTARARPSPLANLSLVAHTLGDDEVARDHAQEMLRIAQEIGHRSNQGYALNNLGHALAGLNRLAEAAEIYRQAVALRHELGEHFLAVESLAGLARVSLAEGNLAEAQAQVEEILAYLDTGSLEGTDEPLRIYLTCYHVLKAGRKPRAQEVLATAHDLLQQWANRIVDEDLRRSLLKNVRVHRRDRRRVSGRASGSGVRLMTAGEVELRPLAEAVGAAEQVIDDYVRAGAAAWGEDPVALASTVEPLRGAIRRGRIRLRCLSGRAGPGAGRLPGAGRSPGQAAQGSGRLSFVHLLSDYPEEDLAARLLGHVVTRLRAAGFRHITSQGSLLAHQEAIRQAYLGLGFQACERMIMSATVGRETCRIARCPPVMS